MGLFFRPALFLTQYCLESRDALEQFECDLRWNTALNKKGHEKPFSPVKIFVNERETPDVVRLPDAG